MADNFDNYSMKVQARVDLPSNKYIDAQIRKLEKSISKLKISGQFDDTALRNLTNQLNTLKASITTANFSPTALTELTNQVNRALQNVNIGNINVGNINVGNTNGINNQAQNISNSFTKSKNAIDSFKKSLSNAGKGSKEIDSIIRKIQNLNVNIDALSFSESTKGMMNVDVSGLDEFGNKVKITRSLIKDLKDESQWNVSNTTTSVISTKELENINNAFVDYTAKIAQFKSTNTNILSGLTEPLNDFESKLNGLKDGVVSVREVRDAFKTLNTEASKITQNFTGQLSKTDAAIRRLAKGEEEIKMLEASLKGLNNTPKEVLKEINTVSRLLKNVQDIESKEGRTANWASAYRTWADEVDKLSAKISVLHKQESNNATSTVYSKKDIENLLYVQKIMNTVSKTETELRKKLTKAGYTDIKITGIEDVNGKVEKLQVTANNAAGALEKINFARVKVQGEGNSKKIQDWLVQSGDVKILKSATTAQEELSESVSSVSVNLEKLKTKWKEQGILVGEFKEKVDKLELSLKSVGSKNELDKVEGTFEELKKDADASTKIIEDLKKAYKKIKDIEIEIKSLDNIKDSEKISILSQNQAKAQKEFDSLFYKLSKQKNYNKDHWEEIKQKIDDATQSQINYNDASKKDSLSKIKGSKIEDLNNLKEKWEEQGILVGEFKEKVDQLESSLKSVGSRGELDSLNSQMKQLKKESSNLFKEQKEKAKEDRQQEIAQQKEIDKILSKQESAYKDIWNIKKEISKLDSNEDSDIIDKLNEKKKIYQDIYLSAQKELQIYNSIAVSQEHIASLTEIRKKAEAEISIISSKKTQKDLKTSSEEEQKIQKKFNDIILSNDISKLETRYKKFGVTSNEAEQSIKDLRDAYNNLLKSKGTDRLSDAIEDFNKKLKIAKSSVDELTTTQVSMARRVGRMTEMQDWMRKNQKAVGLVGKEIQDLIEECKTCDSIRFDQIGNRFKELKVEAGEAGLLGNTFFGSIVNEGKKFLQWTSITSVIMEVSNKVRQAVGEIRQLDDVLTEISKTSDLTSKQLEKLGDNAFDTASKYGKSANDFLVGIQEMYRAGFNNAEQMAELSVLAQSAGDMESTSANDYIMATNAAYDLKANAKELNEILDSQNYITNNAAISMQDMADATSEAASVAAQYGVSIDELTALTAVAVSKTRESGSEVGTALKSIFANLQDTTNKAIVSAFDSVGISMTKMVGDSEQLKTPIELIKELSVAFNSLPEGDVKRANILNDIAGKYHINTFSAILADLDAYNDMIELYNSQEADGSAFREAQKSAENFSGALNRLSNTWIDTVDNVLNSDLLTGFVNGLNTALNLLNTLTDSFGTLGTAIAGVGVFAGFKNIGTANYISSPSNKLF